MKQPDHKPKNDDHSEILKREADDITGKIDEKFDKLAKKLREKAEKAKEKLNDTKKDANRAVLLRRFELYSDAANHLEEFSAPRREGNDKSSD
ncbi:hypothetical protein [Methylobacterium sp. GC_Met_2]|uniref:hypothetical protein n=1 Tax=Methylobacterium sp. GC_Met_2 TaxID=2937376 RepID=UPI00226B2AD2|nr:hypothetical protein [Methylobacterium sp. GC_Met_2]